MLLYMPESTEAEVAAARNFQSDNLSLEEYALSRTLLHEVLERGESLLVRDASQHPEYSKSMSVIAYELKSVLVTPILQNGRTIGAIYLDNKSLPAVFDEDDRAVVECVSRFTSFDILVEYSFPGNVRELENLIHRLAVLSDSESVGVLDLPREIQTACFQRVNLEGSRLRRLFPSPPRDLRELRHREGVISRAFSDERRYLAEHAVRESAGNVSEAAQRLGVHRVILYEMLGKGIRGKNRAKVT